MDRTFLATPVIITGPAAVGKKEMINALMHARGCDVPPTLTTRPPRALPDPGGDYLHVSKELFEALLAGDALTEASLTRYYYGMPYTVMVRGGNRCVLFAAGYRTAEIFRAQMPCKVIGLLPPNRETLEKRLKNRKVDDARLGVCMEKAYNDIVWISERADFVVVNDTLDEAVDTVANILDGTAKGSACRTYFMAEQIGRVMQSFEDEPMHTFTGYLIDDDMRCVQEELDCLFDKVFREERAGTTMPYGMDDE